MGDRGDLLFKYAPLPMSPMTVALLLLFAIATFLLGPLLLPPDLWPVNGVCFLPFAAVAAWAFLQRPGPTRIYAKGIESSLPAWRRLMRQRAYVPWGEVRNVYPATYEVAGAALSPFASSAGTLLHVGLGLETSDGRRRTVRFTPGAIRAFRGATPGFVSTMEAVRRAFRDLGRPLVTDVHPYSDEEIVAMHAEARRPLVGLGAIVYAFFLPGAIAAAGGLLVNALGLAVDTVVVLAILTLAAIPPIASVAYTFELSRRRNYLMNELAKHQEFLRERGG